MAVERVRAFVGLGSNLGKPAGQVRHAMTALDALPGTGVTAASRLYRTAPWGITDQPDFVNAVAEIATDLEPQRLLDALQALEREAGRFRDGERWGPRVLDLDLLLYDDRVSSDARLTLPHPRMHQRAFVLVPLLEIAPDTGIPGLGPAAHLLDALDASDVVPMESTA